MAAETMPGEDQAGLLFRLTHLHPAAYFVLFLVFVLSVANLVYQGKISGPNSLIAGVFSLFGKAKGSLGGEPVFDKGLRGPRPESLGSGNKKRRAIDSRRMGGEGFEAAVVAVRKLPKPSEDSSDGAVTPLEGVNHPLPQFAPVESTEPGRPRLVDSKPDKKTVSAQFKFASAVDLPSQEEIERREKEQLLVSGCVKGSGGKGIGSVIVYLTDMEGNRVGQSCRSVPETGEFKVLVNEPGKYILSGYKRGFVMENTEPMIVPIESGKIEGYNFRMIPEGCLVQGRVMLREPDEHVQELKVKCVCRSGDFSRSAVTESDGQFRISGVPPNSKCYVEVIGPDENLLSRSESFETVQKKELFLEIKIPSDETSPSV